jgi:hypothetical protein
MKAVASDRKEIDDIAIEVDCSMILVKEGEVDIGELHSPVICPELISATF